MSEPELPEVQDQFQCVLTHPLLGRCAREGGKTSEHHIIHRSAEGSSGPTVRICQYHHDQIHPQPDFPIMLKRCILTKKRGGYAWISDPDGQPVELRDEIAEVLNRSYLKPKPGVYGYLQSGNVFEPHPETKRVRCPSCSKQLNAKKPPETCGACGFTLDGWIWLIWQNVEVEWQERAITGDSSVDDLILQEERVGWKMAQALGDMEVGRLWQLHGFADLNEYAASKGKRGVTFRQYLKAEARVRALPEELQEPTRSLPIRLLVSQGIKFEQLSPDQIIELARIRQQGSPTAALRAAIDDMIPTIEKRGSLKKRVEVEVFASAVSFRVELNVAPGDDAVDLAMERVLTMAYVDGVNWKKKGHQVKKLRA